MKKLGLISVLSLGLILAGCAVTTTSQGSSDIMGVYNESKEMTCTLNYTSEMENGTVTLYVKDGMTRTDVVSSIEGEEYSMYTISKDGKIYAWGDVYGMNMGFYTDDDTTLEDKLNTYQDSEDWSDILCVKGVKKGNSIFELPSDISFTSADDIINSANEYVEDIDQINEEITSIANPASEYCLAQGGESFNTQDGEGNQIGMCRLSDGSEVDEWEYYRNSLVE